MAEPARKLEDGDTPGDAESATPNKAHLKSLEGGGETSEPDHSWYKPNGKDKDSDSEDSGEPNKKENEEADEATERDSVANAPDDEESSLFSYASGLADDDEKPSKRRSRRWLFGKRRAALGGGFLATVIAIILFFTFASGPLQFVHIAQLLEQFHFSSQQNDSDDRFTKIARYIHYNSQGKVQNTRIGILQRKYLKPIDLALTNTGIESSYTPVFGFKDGYVIDPEKLSTKSAIPELQGKSPEEIKAYFNETLPSAEVTISEGKVFINAKNLGVRDNKSLNRLVMKAAGIEGVNASIGARIMGTRDGVTWHPIKKLDNAILKSVEDRYLKWRQNQATTIDEGEEVALATENGEAGDKNATQATKDSASTAQAAAEEALTEGGTAGAGLASGQDPIPKFTNTIKFKLTGGVAAATGILCTARGLAKSADTVKHDQVVLPLIRLGGQAIALGSQVQSGQGVDLEQLSFFNKQLSGVDSTGNVSSWQDAQSIQSGLGHPDTGVPASKTLQTIGKGSPFDFLLPGGIYGTVLDGACSAVGTALTTVVSFLGGPVSTTIGLAISYALGPQILSPLVHWLAGDAVNVFAIGADFGSNIDYGSLLAANGQAISSGGRPLKPAEVAQLDSLNSSTSQSEFSQHSIAYKLFDPYDERSAISKVIDKTSPSATQNFASLGGWFLNFGNTLGNLPRLFTSTAHAAAPIPYNYGFPVFGFSEAEMNSQQTEDPFANAQDVVDNVLPANPSYVKRAMTCFGVTIDPETYDITSWLNPEPTYKNISNGNCNDPAESWVKLRFYVFDTQTMENAACYYGDDQSCSDIGFTSSSSTTTPVQTGDPPTPVINSFTHNGGNNSNSFSYNVSNASSCYIQTDNPPDSQQPFSPTLNADSSVTAGNGGSGTLFCMDQSIGPVSQAAN